MKHIIILITLIGITSCGSKHIIQDTNIQLQDSITINKVDSTAIHNTKNEDLKIEENTATVVEENIIEEIKDSTTTTKRIIQRTIKQETGNSISSVIEEKVDTTYINKEKTQETKDEKAIQYINEEKKESNKIKYIFGIVLLVLIGYIIFKFKR